MDRYKLKDFARWAKKEGLTDGQLSEALDEMDKGLLGDQLGAGIYKKRIGSEGKGKRGSVRAIIVFKQDDLAVYLYGYAKNEKSDLKPREEKALRIFAKELLKLSPTERLARVRNGSLVRIAK